MAKRREFNVFSLSFLDIMSCGFGAVILIYIVINHATEVTSQELNVQLMAEVKKIEEQVEDETENLVMLRNTLDDIDDEIVTTEGLVLEIINAIKELQAQIEAAEEDGASQQQNIEDLKAELRLLEQEAASLEGSVAGDEASGSALRTFLGDGERQYLTGLRLGGDPILILLDASASMLDETIVNVIRRRNMPEAERKQAEKWQRAIRTIEWITANLPRDTQFQLMTFNTETRPAIAGTEGKWLETSDPEALDNVVEALADVVPSGGTSLQRAFIAAVEMRPQPETIFRIVDSLPTQGLEEPRRTNVSSRQRVDLFSDALDALPQVSSVNVILFPMEGDPIAAPSYWRLAQMTGGSFLSPPEDWP